MPLDAGLRSRRGNVIAPAIERARFIASPHAAKVAHETSPASRQSATLKHEGSQTAHEKARVAPAKPATPARERHAAPAPRVEAVRPPHGHEPVVTSSARQAPPPAMAPPLQGRDISRTRLRHRAARLSCRRRSTAARRPSRRACPPLQRAFLPSPLVDHRRRPLRGDHSPDLQTKVTEGREAQRAGTLFRGDRQSMPAAWILPALTSTA